MTAHRAPDTPQGRPLSPPAAHRLLQGGCDPDGCRWKVQSVFTSFMWHKRPLRSVLKLLRYVVKLFPYVVKTLRYVVKLLPYVVKTLRYVAKLFPYVVKTLRYVVKLLPYVVKTLRYIVKLLHYVVKSVGLMGQLPRCRRLGGALTLGAAARDRPLVFPSFQRTPSIIDRYNAYGMSHHVECAIRSLLDDAKI